MRSQFVRTFTVPAALAVAALAPAGTAFAQEEAHGHGDVSPRVSSGQIVTDAYVDATQALVPGVRVFALEFQESPSDPYAINDPGFNALAGSGLPAGSRVGFEPVRLPAAAGDVTALAYWDGVTTTPGGAPAFGPAPQGETLTFNFLSQDRTLSSTDPLPTGFFFGSTVPADGSFHQHLNTLLNDGPGPSPVPLDGVYLVGLRVTSNAPGVAASEPAYFVFNNGLTEDQHDAAIDFVGANVVPEPAVLPLAFGLAGASLLKRGRWSRE